MVSHDTHMTQGLSDDNLLSLDVDYYEHPHNQTEWLAVRGAMLSGGRGQHSLLMWSALEREVYTRLILWRCGSQLSLPLNLGDVCIAQHHVLLCSRH